MVPPYVDPPQKVSTHRKLRAMSLKLGWSINNIKILNKDLKTMKSKNLKLKLKNLNGQKLKVK